MRKCWLRDAGLQINTKTNRSRAGEFRKFVFRCSVLVPNSWMWTSDYTIVRCFCISQHPQHAFSPDEAPLLLWQSLCLPFSYDYSNEISSDERTRPIILTESRMCTKPNAAPPGRSRWLAPVNGPATLHCNVIHTFFALAPGISATFDINSNCISKLRTLIALSSIFAVCHNIYHLLKRFLELLLHNLEATSWKGGLTRKRLLFFYDMSFVLESNQFPISCYFCSWKHSCEGNSMLGTSWGIVKFTSGDHFQIVGGLDTSHGGLGQRVGQRKCWRRRTFPTSVPCHQVGRSMGEIVDVICWRGGRGGQSF